MTFRRKILIVVALALFLSAGSVAWIVSLRTRREFDQADAKRSAALVLQFRREFTRRGEDVARRIAGVAAGETVSRMALDLSHNGDPAAYVTEAGPLAETHQLDFLELLAEDGAIISSAQWPARFGYKEVLPAPEPAGAFMKLEDTPDGPALGLFAVQVVRIGDKPLYVIGGERLDREFLDSLALPAGMRVFLYRNAEGGFSRNALLSSAPLEAADKLQPLIQQVQQKGEEAGDIIRWSSDPADSETFQAIPLKSDAGALLGVLLVGSSRRGLVELQHQIQTVALVVGGLGILFAIVVSSWVAARVTKPIDQLAEAAREVTAGNWNTEVHIASVDELGQLADAFNRMTGELLHQRERLVQTERVAAWRELARRLAHELKNPLFPLQITVENLMRAREATPEQFDEVFRESAATLLAEIANLKTIIGRFSDFSKMPQPQLQRVQVNDIARQVLALHEAQFHAEGKPAITATLDADKSLPAIDADPDLLHRALSNLVLNAMDAMPDGGAITIRTRNLPEAVRMEVADAGTGFNQEECERLFTPYYTTKQHGTGLGLAIVQSVVSDHKGSISVKSAPGHGAAFLIELPKRLARAANANT
jgi:two-component system nitrogen regulation sensor histidine kinase NtrY